MNDCVDWLIVGINTRVSLRNLPLKEALWHVFNATVLSGNYIFVTRSLTQNDHLLSLVNTKEQVTLCGNER